MDVPAIAWSQSAVEHMLTDVWLARLCEPYVSHPFAYLRREDGRWRVTLWIRGEYVGVPGAYWLLSQAKRHVERWGLARWQSFPPRNP